MIKLKPVTYITFFVATIFVIIQNFKLPWNVGGEHFLIISNRNFQIKNLSDKSQTKSSVIRRHAKIIKPNFRHYDPAGVFGSFANYNVESRNRVFAISAIDNIPLSTQWQVKPYFYPIQIAQYALEHYSKNLTVSSLPDIRLPSISGWKTSDNLRKFVQFHTTNFSNYNLKFQTPSNNWQKFFAYSLYTNFTEKKAQIYPGFRIRLKFDNDNVGGFSVVIRLLNNVKYPKSQLFQIHYLRLNEILQVRQPGHIIYGIGKSCCMEFKEFTRNIVTDFNKGYFLLQKKLNVSASKSVPSSRIQLISLILRGSGFLEDFPRQTASSYHMDHFWNAVNFLTESQNKQSGALLINVSRNFHHDSRFKLRIPWVSAMAQGHFLSCVSRAYALTGDEKYREAAVLATKPFNLDSNQCFGVRASLLGKFPWFEEYPTRPNGTFVLNGFIYSILGLFDSWKLCKDDEAGRLFKIGLKTLKASLKLFDVDHWSSYDLRHLTTLKEPNLSRPDYHTVHVFQLFWLFVVTRDFQFKSIAEKWENYAKH